MSSILFLKEVIYCNILRCIYLRNENDFCNFFKHFLNLESIFEHFHKKDDLMYFLTDGFSKTWLDKCLKSPLSEDSSRSHIVNGPKHCWNLKDSTFTIVIDRCEDFQKKMILITDVFLILRTPKKVVR